MATIGLISPRRLTVFVIRQEPESRRKITRTSFLVADFSVRC